MKPVKVYTSDFCPFCSQAKSLLERNSVPFEEINLQNDLETRKRLSDENGGWRTVPMIFIGDEFIGGFQELSNLHRAGDLSAKLEA